jgi:hypothetical protein
MNRRVVWFGVVAGVVGVAVGCGGQVERDFDRGNTEESGASEAGTGGSGGHGGGGSDSATTGVVSGAGGSAGAEPREPLCNGSGDVRLGTSWIPGGQVGIYYGFLNPLGRRYLLIDGHCQFWVSVDGWEGVRSGTLAADQAQAIETSIYAQLDELSGAWTTRGCRDGGTWRVFDDTYELSCYCLCSDEGVPPAVSEVVDAVVELENELWAIGDPYRGPLRVVAIDGTHLASRDYLEWQPWPLPWSPEEALYNMDIAPPPPTAGVLLENRADLEALRTLRRDYIAAHGPIENDDDAYLPVTSEGALFRVLMRDVTPWDPDGA